MVKMVPGTNGTIFTSLAERYRRQEALPGFGAAAQERLRMSHALVVGCGALGCAQVDLLARAGIGELTLVDRDVVEATNLQRQCLFTERDAREGAPKAEAAARRVREVNSEVRVHACVEHLGADNAEDLARGCTIVVDGLDNYRTRYALNDVAVKRGLPYVHAGAVGWRGTSAPLLAGAAKALGLAPGDAPCLRCLFPEPPPPGEGETCDTAGVFGPVVAAVAAHAAAQVLLLAAGLGDRVDRSLAGAARHDCPCCAQRRFEWLATGDRGEGCGAAGDDAVVLCGRNAVQVRPHGAGAAAGAAGAAGRGEPLDLAALATRLAAHGAFELRGSTLVGRLSELRARDGGELELTVFGDGRAIVRGSVDTDLARIVYDRLVGR
jgi:molybdopterin-synthase adenylyltransferase